jgi:hypothetical protein
MGSKEIFDTMDGKIDIAISEARAQMLEYEKTLVPPTPPVPTNVYDSYSQTYVLTVGNKTSPNGKMRLIYTGNNPANRTNTGQAGVRVPSAVPEGVSMPNVFFAYPYNTPNNASGTSASLTLTETEFGDFDLSFWMRTIKGWRSPAPKNWEVAWLLLRFNPAGYQLTDKGAHFHHYFYDIQRNGVIEFGRKDNTQFWEEQTFLTTSGRVNFADQKWLKIRIKAQGNHFTNWVDGVQKFDIVDDGKIGTRKKQVITNGVASSVSIPVEAPSSYMDKGRLGNYSEDSEDEWSPYIIN